MSYGDYGLDAVKKSRESGQTEKWWFDPWSDQRITTGRQFYMCFSNWVASRRTIEAFATQEPVENVEGDQCLKCRKKAPKMHYHINGLEYGNRGMYLALCPECVAWAAEYLNKEDTEKPVDPGKQFELF
nr:hypothetical protein [uncultured Arsenicibacter sp.]